MGAKEEQPGQLGHPDLGTAPGWWHRCRLPALSRTPARPLLLLLLWSCASTTCSHHAAGPGLGREGDRSDLTEVPGDKGQTWGETLNLHTLLKPILFSSQVPISFNQTKYL